MKYKFTLIISILLVCCIQKGIAATYYVHPKYGNDLNSGVSKKNAFKTLTHLTKIKFLPGDRILLASGQVYTESLNLIDQKGMLGNPIVITAIEWEGKDLKKPAIIDFKSQANGVLIEDCSFIEISNIKLTANGYTQEDKSLKMRCGLLLTAKNSKLMEHILIQNIVVQEVFYEIRVRQRERRSQNGKRHSKIWLGNSLD